MAEMQTIPAPQDLGPVTTIAMNIGSTIRAYRQQKGMSQGDIETRTGLLRCYVSRVENGHTVPSLETLEKFARAFGVPIYRLFFDGNEPATPPKLLYKKTPSEIIWGSDGNDARAL